MIAPAVDDEALAILAAKANMRVVTADFATARATDAGRELRSILGAVLVQARDRVTRGLAAVAVGRAARRDEAAADRATSGRRCDSRGASART